MPHLLNNWDIIDRIAWAEKSSQRRYYNEAKVDLMQTYSVETMATFAAFVNNKFVDLNERLEQFAKNTNARIPGDFGGDDSYDDMLNHVIGSGSRFYNAIMEDPDMLNDMEYVESFSYCIPNADDYKYLSADWHRAQARKCITELARIVNENKPSPDDLGTISCIMSRMILMVAGNFAEAVRGYPQRTYDNYYKFDANDKQALFANVISDYKVHMG